MFYSNVSNYSAVAGIRTVTCLTAWNMDRFKFVAPLILTRVSPVAPIYT